jgi:hypothetical protein
VIDFDFCTNRYTFYSCSDALKQHIAIARGCLAYLVKVDIPSYTDCQILYFEIAIKMNTPGINLRKIFKELILQIKSNTSSIESNSITKIEAISEKVFLNEKSPMLKRNTFYYNSKTKKFIRPKRFETAILHLQEQNTRIFNYDTMFHARSHCNYLFAQGNHIFRHFERTDGYISDDAYVLQLSDVASVEWFYLDEACVRSRGCTEVSVTYDNVDSVGDSK